MKDVRKEWKKLLADYVIYRIEKKDTSVLIEKGLSILPKEPKLFFNMEAITPLMQEFLDTLYSKTAFTLQKSSDGTLQVALDSVKPRKGENLVTLFKLNSKGIRQLPADTLVTVFGNGFKPVQENGKWSVKISKIFSVTKSSKKVPDTVKEILAKAIKDKTFLSSSTELELFKKAKLLKVNEQNLPEVILDTPNTCEVNSVIELKKFDNEKRLVYGVVYEPNVVDADGHETSPDIIEEAAHGYLEDFSDINLMHERPLDSKVKVVESYIAPTDLQIDNAFIKKGSWILVVKIYDDNIWEAVKSGVLNAFSLEGKGII